MLPHGGIVCFRLNKTKDQMEEIARGNSPGPKMFRNLEALTIGKFVIIVAKNQHTWQCTITHLFIQLQAQCSKYSRANPKGGIDSVGAGTSSSSYGTYQSPPSCFSVDVCPEVLLAGLTLAAGVGFLALYQQITQKGRRKRDQSASMHNLVSGALHLLMNNGKN